jgi:1-acyl-sn-glycerol-3-phosphate acyltransferase
MRTIVLRPEDGSIGVNPNRTTPEEPRSAAPGTNGRSRDGYPTAPTLPGCHTRRMAVPTRTPAAAGPTGSGSPLARASTPLRLDIQAPARSWRRYRVARAFVGQVARLYSRVRVEGLERLPAGPSILCFSHESWADPIFLLAALPLRPRAYFFGPEQEDMRRGFRNRIMRWSGLVIPYRPGKRGLVAATARAATLLDQGSLIAIAGEGRIHSGEGFVLPLRGGPAYLALRAGVPIVPVSINGTGWLGFRRIVRIRVGLPIETSSRPVGRPSASDIARLSEQTQLALEMLVADFPDQPRSGLVGRWLTELFNDWPNGSRPPAQPGVRSRRELGQDNSR